MSVSELSWLPRSERGRVILFASLVGIQFFIFGQSVNWPMALGLVVVALTVLLLLDALQPAWYKAPAALHRARLIKPTLLVYALMTAQAGLVPAFLPQIAATVVLVADCWSRGELCGPERDGAPAWEIDPRELWRGGTAIRLMLLSWVLCGWSFYAGWTPSYILHATSETHSGWTFYNPARTLGGDGAIPFLPGLVVAALFLGAALWACWRGWPRNEAWWPRIPAVIAAVMTFWLITRALAGESDMENGIWTSTLSAAGPGYFLLGFIPFILGAFFAFRGGKKAPIQTSE
ncbi:membrane hypothetical protein [Rhodospirillaceae bacterium LM-1]|nr:membrane hypothetical protein [Rhodospirillaceae bacterium LM-1]